MRSLVESFRTYGVALAAVITAFLAALWIGVGNDRTVFATYAVAVVAAGYASGLQPGIFATILAAAGLVVQYGLFPPFDSGAQLELLPNLGLFLAVGLCGSYLASEWRRAVGFARQLHDTIGQMADAVILTNAQGRVTYLNAAAQGLTGWRRGEAANEPLGTVLALAAEGGQAVTDPLTGLNQPGPVAVPVRRALLATKDGGKRPVEYWTEYLRDRQGTPTGALVFLRDVNDRDQVEKDRQQVEERYRALAACAPTGLLLLDEKGQCVFANPAAQSLGGFSAEEAKGGGWARYVHPEDQAIAAEWMTWARQGRPFARELRFQGASGRVRWVLLKADTAKAADGQPLGHVGTLEDISARKQAEKDLAALRLQQQEQAEHDRQKLDEIEADRVKLRGEVDALRAEQSKGAGNWQQTEAQLRKQLADLTAAAQKQREAAQQTEAKLRQQVADLTRRFEDVENRLLEAQETEAHLRREQAEWLVLEEKLRRDAAEHAELAKLLEEELGAVKTTVDQKHREVEQHRTGWQKTEAQYRQQIAELEEHLAERRKLAEAERHDFAESARAWLRMEAQLRKQLDELAESHQGAQGSFAELQTLTESMAKEREQWRQAEAQLKGRLAELEHHTHRTREQLTQRESLEEQLRRELAEVQQAEAGLRDQLTGHSQNWQQAEARLRKELGELAAVAEKARRELTDSHQREDRLQQELAALRNEAKGEATTLRRRADFLRQVIERTAAGVLAWDEYGQVTVANQRACEWLGLPDEGAAAGDWGPYVRLYRADGKHQLEADDAPFGLARRHEVVVRTEVVAAPKVGPTRALVAEGSPLWDNEGRVVGSALTLHDATEYKRAVEEWQEKHQGEKRTLREERSKWRRERAELETLRQRTDLLAEVGSVLAAAADLTEASQGLAKAVVPLLADACLVCTRAEDDAALQVTGAVLTDGGTVRPFGPLTAGAVLAGFLHDQPAALHVPLPEALRDEVARLLDQGGGGLPAPGSAASVPLAGGGGLLLVRAQDSQAVTADDLALGEELIRRNGVALARARRVQVMEAERDGLARQARGYRVLVDGLGEGVCAIDANGLVSYLNPAGEALLGVRAGDLRGRPADDLFDLDDAAPGERGGLWRRLAERAPLKRVRARWRGAGGDGVGLTCTATLLGDHLGADGAALVLGEAIPVAKAVPAPPPTKPARPQAEPASPRRVTALADWDRWADRLRPVTGRLDQAVRAVRQALEPTPEGQEPADWLDHHVQHLVLLCDALAAAGQLARGAVTLFPEPVEVGGLLDRAVNGIDRTLRLRQHHLTVALPLGPDYLRADPEKLGLVLALLLDNAARYTPPGGHVFLEAQRHGPTVTLRVRDSGPGLSPERLADLRQLDARAGRYWDGPGDGLGIGLAVVRALTELHGGEVELGGDPLHGGGEVALHLPALVSPAVAEAPARPEAAYAGEPVGR